MHLTTFKTKIIIKYKDNINLKNLREIKLNTDDCFIKITKKSLCLFEAVQRKID